MEEFLNRTLGFLPQRSVLWGAIITTLLALTVQYFIRWFEKKTILPWMLEENQLQRHKLLGEKREGNAIKNDNTGGKIT